ncbi:MAG TPA: hypothetical protein PKZ08_14100 [Vicinamibacterales bacterium]|nr:hypothetical protein [Vicinamibacterales bacterium]
MTRELPASALIACLLAMAAPLAAQIESHALSRQWPVPLLPPAVVEPPKNVGTNEISMPLDDKPVADPAPAANGDPKAASLDSMMSEPKNAIALAQAGKWAEAIAAGRPLLDKPKETYADFTWDYLANAVAWAQIQSDQYAEAVKVHQQAARQVTDPDLNKYHLQAARVISETLTGKARLSNDGPLLQPDALKDPATLRALLRAAAAEDLAQFKKHIELISKASTPDARVANVKLAYARLRTMKALDPALADETSALLRAAVDTLVTDAASKGLEAAAAQHRKVAALISVATRRDELMAKWNPQVLALWSLVAETKRLCRIHDYLKRLGLAGEADSAAAFQSAHQQLFVDGQPQNVYRPMGGRVQYYERGDVRLTAPDYRRIAPATEVFGANP